MADICVCYMLDAVLSTSHVSSSGNCHNNHMKWGTTIIPHSEMRKLTHSQTADVIQSLPLNARL